MATRMQQRRGTAAQWTGANPILAAGEIGFETDTGKFKIGNGSSAWSALNYYVDANAILDGAPGVLNTLNELAEALGDDPAFITTVATNLSNHASDTSNVHGIVDTTNLATLSGTETLTNKTLTSPSLTGVPTAPTPSSVDNSTKIATTQYVQGKISELIESSPSTLDTLNELATALGNDANFATTVTNNIATKVSKSGDTMTGLLTLSGQPVATLHAANKGYVDTEISSHNSDTTNVHGIADTEALATKTYADNAVSTHSSNTTSVHGITDTAALATKTYADNAVSTHNSDTTNVHGIANTEALATKTYADDAVSTHSSDTTNVHGIADTSAIVLNTDLTAHNNDTTSVHGIADTSLLVVTSDSRLSDTRTPTDNTVSTDKIVNSAVTAVKLAGDSVTTAKIEDGAVTSAKIADGTIVNADINASAAIAQSKISGLSDSFAAKADLASPTFTGTVVLPTVTAGGSIVPSTDNTYDLGSPTKMWKDLYVGPGSLYVNGQKVIQDDSGNIVVSADPNENLALRTSGSGNVELDPTGTGTVNIKGPLVVEAGANFSSADGNGISFSNGINTDSITSKTLNTDLSLSGNGTGKVYLNDNAEVSGNLVVGGNLTVSGTTTTVNSETISLADNIIDLNSNFTTGTPTENAGLRVMRGDSNSVQVRWNESSDVWEFTKDGAAYSTIAGLDSPTFTGTVTIPAGASISGYAPTASPTFTGTVTLPAAGIVFSDGTQAKEGVPSRTTINSATGAYNLSTGGLALRDTLIECNSSSAFTVTIPTNATTAFPVGTSIDLLQTGAGQITVAGAAGVTVNATPGLKLRTQWSSATLFKRATDTWVVMGDLSA